MPAIWLSSVQAEVLCPAPRAVTPAQVERVGGINQAYAWSKSFSDRFSGVVKQWKRKHPKAYRVMRPVLAAVVVGALVYWLFG